MVIELPTSRRPAEFVGGALRELRALPKPVRSVFGQAILQAQVGGKHPDAKPLRGFSGAGVLEVVEAFEGDAYRAVYTVKFAGVIYVLYAFQKKGKHGRATPKIDIDRIRKRLRLAEEHYKENYRVAKTG
jgi:phage-related protein